MIETAIKEAKEEIGLVLHEDSLFLFAIRDNPYRDIVPGRKLSKFVLGLPPDIQIEVEAHHNLDFVFATKTVYDIPIESLIPGDPEEVEAIVLVNCFHPPLELPIRDDKELLFLFGKFCARADFESPHAPISLSKN